MSCEISLDLVSSLHDGRLAGGEREKAVAHVAACPDCILEYRWLETFSEELKAARQAEPPDWLARLRVLASHAIERQLRRSNPKRLLAHWADPFSLAFDHLAKPMALPLAGGLLSALLLFGTVLQQAFPAHFRDDVPTIMSTEADGQVVDWAMDNKHYYESGMDAPRIRSLGSDTSGDATVVQVTIDPNGYVADYTVIRGELPEEAKNLFLLSRFTPATLFGYPAWGKKLVLFRSPRAARG